MKYNKDIFNTVYPICREVESQIVGQNDQQLCDYWGNKNALRATLTIEFIIKQYKQFDKKLTILNLSGLSCGHQDFSISHYLKNNNIKADIFTLEHPETPYRTDDNFQNRIKNSNINVIYADLRHLDLDIFKKLLGEIDIILFTEIAEHLEHSVLLNCIKTIKQLLSPQGKLLLTTPNLDRLKYRINHLFGQPIDYWGDGRSNLDSGLFGHIVYYNIPRLRSLLADSGLTISNSKTINYPFNNPTDSKYNKFKNSFNRFISDTLIFVGEQAWRLPNIHNSCKTMGELIYIEAIQGEIKPISLKL